MSYPSLNITVFVVSLLASCVVICSAIRNRRFFFIPKGPTFEFKYNPKELKCLGANAQNRSKTPYVLFSSRQHQWEQDWGASMPRISVTAITDAAATICPIVKGKDDAVDDVDLILADLEPQEKPPKCPWVPPCGAAFGAKAERMKEKKKMRLRDSTSQPPPGAYDLIKDTKATKANHLGSDPWTLAAMVDRAPTPKEGVGPACYTLKAPMDQDLEDLEKRFRTFDSLYEERLAPLKHGYFARERVDYPPTENTNVPSFVEIMQSERNKKRGVFSKTPRFPKRYGERCCLNALGYNIDKDTPFTGPGRYDPYKYEKKPAHRYSGLAKAAERKTDPEKEKNWADRLRPTKATNMKGCGECKEVFDGSHVKLC
ncbi:hypothetical protein EGR_08382 [Echinococcus granulosus]|uniref:Uncharacterized protein n=1 Tax=Echinococcus granulosus TaxID=6210 RepID=W6UTJ7_ECHGR|nr:hypothetical protein EGR_08382 [Echinococcus granulosus]EUB56739.1 hypothetical protein EGR_08382 [Echinococcus granulosus]